MNRTAKPRRAIAKNRIHTAHAIETQSVHLLYTATRRALVKTRDILESLSCHLAMSLLHVRSLALRDSLQNTLPDIAQKPGDRLDRGRDCNGKGR